MNEFKKVKLVLETGDLFEGTGFGKTSGSSGGEIVFNTSHSGYQEIITDPSYTGQLVVMTNPLIGNYGTNTEDIESDQVSVRGLIIKELSLIEANYRSKKSLHDYLSKYDVMGISDIDTRRLVRIIRKKGALRGIIFSHSISDKDLVKKVKELPKMKGSNLVKEVSRQSMCEIKNTDDRYSVAAFDFGIKKNIVRILRLKKCSLLIMPFTTSAKKILDLEPDGIFLSNGPGDPDAVKESISTIKKLTSSKFTKREIPIFGICLGHQLLSLALGAETYKLKFGHHGANHPVKDLKTGKVEITSQNHGFAVKESSLPKCLKITHRSLYDSTVEGICHKTKPFYSVQYHPEGAPGPRDSFYLFDDFLNWMQATKL